MKNNLNTLFKINIQNHVVSRNVFGKLELYDISHATLRIFKNMEVITLSKRWKNMDETKINQHTLFGETMRTNRFNELVIKDSDEKEKYLIEEIKNKVIWGDAFKVLKKIDNEVFDMVFIDPPYFYNCLIRNWDGGL